MVTCTPPVVSFCPDYWDGPRHNRHYFCSELSKHVPVLFVSPPFNIARVVDGLTGKRQLTASGVRAVSPSLTTYTPSKFLFTNNRFPAVDQWMRHRRLEGVRKTMDRQGIQRPVLLLWHPQFRHVIGQLDERLVVYYVYDQLTGYTGGTGGDSQEEVELMKKADVVLVLSRELQDAKTHHASNVIHLANAVDFEMFSRSHCNATVVPADIAAIAPPRIGYIGTMNEKLDVPLLERIASARPGWSIVLVGRENYSDGAARQRFQDLVARKNVHWLPYKPPEQVPAYLKGLDVCMMCYVINNWTYYGDPSKLHEYLASGKPTIGVPLSSIRDFSDVVSVVETPEDWIDAIEAGVHERDPDLRYRRIETARCNSYAARVDKFLEIVKARLHA